MRKIKLYPAPHLEIRLFVTDEMVKDYRECAKTALEEDNDKCKDCDTCSWDEVQFLGLCACQLKELEELLEDCHERK